MRDELLFGALGLLVWELCTGLRLCRRVAKEIVTLGVRLDLQALALWRWLRPPRYELVGGCQRRGACCTQIVADPPKRLLARPQLVRWFVSFHKILHNFHLVGRGPEGQLVFSCGYLGTDGRCGIYRLRPRLCRTYPLLPYFAAPKLLPGCGYRVRLRGMAEVSRLPIVQRDVGTHHPTPMRRGAQDRALEHPEDFVLTEAGPQSTDIGL